ncbi:HNH endonuclease [Halomonas coralii]|nr:HNH endonuclease [Modicisalibacter sp. R2A 31.J]MBZ9575086.1 HNH endonuclease [Modicisalibacter sp. MOD 31.J]
MHHILPQSEGGPNTYENAIALCFDCHADAGHYNPKHPKGTKYSREELKKSKSQWIEMVRNNNIEIPRVDEELKFTIMEETATYEEKIISLRRDVVKIFATTHPVGVGAEYHWIKNTYPGCDIKMQLITTLGHITDKAMEKDIYFDVIEIEMADSRTKKIYFDISDFVSHGMVSSSLNEDEFFANKLDELYS